MTNQDNNVFDYGDLCAIGRARADAMVLQMREDQNPLLLTSAIKELAELTPVQIGFFTRIACMLTAQ